MFEAEDVVVWINRETQELRLEERGPRPRDGRWCDPIGANYRDWREATNAERVRLMLETAIDLAMQGFNLGEILRTFAQVKQFRTLGAESYPMCRALTSAMVGNQGAKVLIAYAKKAVNANHGSDLITYGCERFQCLEPNTMSFEELLVHYQGRGVEHSHVERSE